MGEVLSCHGKFVEVNGVKFDKPLNLLCDLVQVVKPVPTQKRLKALFGTNKGRTSAKPAKKCVTKKVCGMAFSYTKKAK